MKVTLVTGTYYAGLQSSDFPAFKGLHGINLEFFPRSSKIGINPKLDPNYNDNWDKIAIWSYPGQRRTVNVPRSWAWMVVKPKGIETIAPRKARTIEIASVMIGLAILWSRLRSK